MELLNNKKSPRKQARRKAFPIHHRTMTWNYQTNAKLVCTEKNRKRLWTRGRVRNINVQYELVMRTEMHDVLWGQISQSCSTLIARCYSSHQFQWHIYNRKHVFKWIFHLIYLQVWNKIHIRYDNTFFISVLFRL